MMFYEKNWPSRGSWIISGTLIQKILLKKICHTINIVELYLFEKNISILQTLDRFFPSLHPRGHTNQWVGRITSGSLPRNHGRVSRWIAPTFMTWRRQRPLSILRAWRSSRKLATPSLVEPWNIASCWPMLAVVKKETFSKKWPY